ncbi:MAG: redox-regulated ATPase YchF [Anaerolineaceae bacterium]|nr:redox-regulated ATPase YchF [Anaerolineaceae bacterium]
MTLQIGLIGLPNVGKSTTFNALTKAQNAAVANYPFCTIEPNKAVVPVPDERLDTLARLVDVTNVIHATIEFVDIAGLVQGASKGEGLGNQFLGNIRDADAVVHVVRCFDDPNVVHISPQPDPRTDIEIINTELMLADLEQLERKIEKLTRQVKGDKKLLPMLETAESLQTLLAAGQPVSAYPQPDSEPYRELVKELRFLTSKPVIYAANVDEASLTEGNKYVTAVRQVASEHGAEVVMLCAKLEEELVSLEAAEREEFLALAGIEESGLAQVIQRSYGMLDLISFFTKNNREARAWTVRRGSTAPQAAGVIHTDFEKGFIRAEVIPYDTFVEFGSETAVKAAGAMRVEGKSYVVQDGDVIYFRFNV